jgi:hypothetical protein
MDRGRTGAVIGPPASPYDPSRSSSPVFNDRAAAVSLPEELDGDGEDGPRDTCSSSRCRRSTGSAPGFPRGRPARFPSC